MPLARIKVNNLIEKIGAPRSIRSLFDNFFFIIGCKTIPDVGRLIIHWDERQNIFFFCSIQDFKISVLSQFLYPATCTPFSPLKTLQPTMFEIKQNEKSKTWRTKKEKKNIRPTGWVQPERARLVFLHSRNGMECRSNRNKSVCNMCSVEAYTEKRIRPANRSYSKWNSPLSR